MTNLFEQNAEKGQKIFAKKTFFLKILDTTIFLVKLIGQLTPVGKGRWITRDVLTFTFIFNTLQKWIQCWDNLQN